MCEICENLLGYHIWWFIHVMGLSIWNTYTNWWQEMLCICPTLNVYRWWRDKNTTPQSCRGRFCIRYYDVIVKLMCLSILPAPSMSIADLIDAPVWKSRNDDFDIWKNNPIYLSTFNLKLFKKKKRKYSVCETFWLSVQYE